MPHEYLNTHDAAKVIGLSEQTLRKYRVQGNGPRFAKVNARVIRYRLADLRDWMEGRPFVTSTSEKASA